MKYILVGLIILFLSFFTVLNPIRDVFLTFVSPVHFGITSIARGIKESVDFYSSVREVRKVNLKLMEENIVLKSDILELKKNALENQILREQLEIEEPKETKSELVLANVLGNPSDLTGSTIILDKGAAHGISKGDTVVKANNLVGIVREVGFSRSNVELITSPNISFTVYDIDSPNRAEGLAVGKHGASIKLTRILPGEILNIDDHIVTSGKDGYFLPGYVVGKITNVYMDPSQPLKEADIETSIDFSKMDAAFVILGQKQ